jgi:hypothetical protein
MVKATIFDGKKPSPLMVKPSNPMVFHGEVTMFDG